MDQDQVLGQKFLVTSLVKYSSSSSLSVEEFAILMASSRVGGSNLVLGFLNCENEATNCVKDMCG